MRYGSVTNKDVTAMLESKPEITRELFRHFIEEFDKIGAITVEPTKTMIGISNAHKRIAWVTQLGRSFIHVVFPFHRAYGDNLCFQKVGQVPGSNQFNHHFRMLYKEDINKEVLKYMKMAYMEEK